MKKQLASLLAFLSVLTTVSPLVGCDGLTGETARPNYNADIQAVAPENITAEHFTAEENTTYYTSPGLSLWMEVNGAYLKMDYFSLDDNKRVYDNLYFYEDDYFYMVSDDNKGWYAALSDSTDAEYAEVETQDGYDIQINLKKSGIYKLTFDIDTLKFDMEYKAEIQTPVYYTIPNCDILSEKNDWIELSVNPENEDEFVLKNFSIAAGDRISFYNHIHTSHYKVTLDESRQDTYASAEKLFVAVNVGGNYNLYINRKTYVVRLELLNPDTATYSCVYYDGQDFLTLEPYETDAPYLFRQRIVVETQYTTSLPKFHTANYKTYRLAVIKSNLIMGSGNYYYFKQAGTYDVIINLKTFEISVELLPE